MGCGLSRLGPQGIAPHSAETSPSLASNKQESQKRLHDASGNASQPARGSGGPVVKGAVPQAGTAPPLASCPARSFTGNNPAAAAQLDELSVWEERQRLAALRRMLATPPGDRFVPITELLRGVFDVPLAFITLIGEKEVFSTSANPAEWTGHPRGDTVCEWALKQRQPEMIIVEDLSADARFQDLSGVKGPPYARFYASAPLVSPGPTALRYGTLAVLDSKPRAFDPAAYQMLAHFTHLIVSELERDLAIMRSADDIPDSRAGLLNISRCFDADADAVVVCQMSEDGWPLVFGNAAAAALLSVPGIPRGTPFWHLFAPVDSFRGQKGQQRLRRVAAKGQSFSLACKLLTAGAPLSRQLSTMTDITGSRFLKPGAAPHSTDAAPMTRAASLPPLPPTPSAPADSALTSVGSGGYYGGNSLSTMGSGSYYGGGSGFYDGLLPGLSVADSMPAVGSPAAPAPLGLPSSPFGTPPLRSNAHSSRTALTTGSTASLSTQVLAVTFAPCSMANILAGLPVPPSSLPAIGIPLVNDDMEEARETSVGALGLPRVTARPSLDGNAYAPSRASIDSSVDGGDQVQPYWFATLRPTTAAARLDMLGVGSGMHSSAFAAVGAGAGSAGADEEHMMRPDAMRDVAMGPLLGVGASGRTYRATWQGSRVAVKIMEVKEPPQQGEDSQDLGWYGSASGSSGGGTAANTGNTGGAGLGSNSGTSAPIVEALLSKALSHPHIVATHAYGVQEHNVDGQRWKEVWIVQELCTRGTLAKSIETGRFLDPQTKKPRLGFIIRTAVEVAGALQYLHSHGILHGDLTGNNILLNASGKDARGFVAMVADFGLSRPLDVLSTLTTGTYGTVSHMPPELIIDGQLTTAADIFSFGVVLWEMMSGRRAWEGMNALQIVNAVTMQRRSLQVQDGWPGRVQSLIQRCLDADADRRPTAKQVLSELEAMLKVGSSAVRKSLDAPAPATVPAPQ